MEPLYLLVDEKVDGIVAAVRDPVIANHLRRGILDVRLYWTRDPFDPRSPECAGFRVDSFFALPKSARTPLFEEKRRLARIRLPLFEQWRNFIVAQIKKFAVFYDDTDDIIAREVAASERGALSDDLRAFAQRSGMSEDETYDYLSLYTRERSFNRLMLRALAEKYSRVINACEAEKNAATIGEEMARDFSALRRT